MSCFFLSVLYITYSAKIFKNEVYGNVGLGSACIFFSFSAQSERLGYIHPKLVRETLV